MTGSKAKLVKRNDIPLDYFYIGELLLYCEMCKDAYEGLNNAPYKSLSPKSFGLVHMFLIFNGNISKILQVKDWGIKTQKALAIDKGSAIFDQKARNYLEHFDERLQQYSKNLMGTAKEDHVMIGRYIAEKDIDEIKVDDRTMKAMFFHFLNHSTMRFQTAEESIDLKGIYEEILDLKERIRNYAELQHGSIPYGDQFR